MPPLQATLSTLLLRLWPDRSRQELLLDLGERKQWTEDDRTEAIVRLAGWLREELLLTERECLSDPAVSEDWRALAAKLNAAAPTRPPGVGAATAALAPLVGASSSKTLANWLTAGLREERGDHRWMRFLARVVAGNVRADALVFHRRSPGTVSEELARRAGVPNLDAGDALLVLSLVSLWQRRKRPNEVRAARGSTMPRRTLPKPVSAMEGHLLAASQLRPLTGAAVGLGPAGADLVAIVLDAALTEVHLTAHVPHRTSAPPGERAGEHWLVAIEESLGRSAVLLGPEETAVFAWRIARMRAYRDRTPTPAPADAARSHPYALLATAIDAARQAPSRLPRFEAGGPGHFMLLPQARRLGLVEGTR